MAPSHSRQLLVWTLPTIAILLSYLWYKKKRIGVRSDTGDTRTRQEIEGSQLDMTLEQELQEADKPALTPAPVINSAPARIFSRSLSGVETAPIDIIIPPELRSVKSHPVDISEEELDLQIEKIKSMKNGTLSRSKSDYSPPQAAQISKTPSIQASSQENKENIDIQETAQMAQKDIAVVEEKLVSLKINNNNTDAPSKREQKTSISNENEQDELQRQSIERDSANHSPLDVMLASPSHSSISDNHSDESSSDSGKGGSDVAATPPSVCDVPVPSDIIQPVVFDFVIPQNLVGKLIGRHGCSINQIKEKTNTLILVKKYSGSKELKVCMIEGAQSDVAEAINMIRNKFPKNTYPELSLDPISIVPLVSTRPLIPDYLYVKLVEGINNDTVVSCMVAPNHLFLQQPTHPTFPNLNILNSYMNRCYTEENPPMLPYPILENSLCAAYSVNAWCRAIILSTDEKTDTSYVRLLDYGGYANIENSKLRQIRQDFMLLPFQAAECFLANIKPIGEDGTWPAEAYNLVAEITRGSIIYTQITDFTEADIPLVLCYVVVGPRSVVFLNEQLVEKGYAEWISTDGTLQQEGPEVAEGGINA